MAIDVSEKAIEVANINVANKKLNNQIQLIKTSIDLINEKFDLIVSNQPYLLHKSISSNIEHALFKSETDKYSLRKNFKSKLLI